MGVPAALIYLIDELELDSRKGCLRRAGQEIHLRPKSFEILLYLVAHRDRLVPKEELIEQFWKGTAISEDVLAHSIAELRRVLGDNTRDPVYVRTVPKRGYRFVGNVKEVCGVSTEDLIATEEITTVEVREEYSDETPEDRYSPIAAGPVALLPPPSRRRGWQLAALPAVIILCSAAALIGWNYWRRPAVPPEPAWWEVAWWKLNEGSGSKIGDSMHGLTATLPAGVSWTQGMSGSALLFSGRELVVSGRDPGVLPAGMAARTLTAWIKTGTTNGSDTVIAGYEDSTSESSGFALMLRETGRPTFGAPIHYRLDGKRRVDDDRWHQVAGVFEGLENRQMRLFVDGVEESAATLPPYLDGEGPGKSVEWSIGTTSRLGGAFRGSIDDVRIFERPLRADEVRSLYRCMSGANDIDIDGSGSYYFAPIWGDHAEVLPRRPGDRSSGVRNTGNDYGGVTFVRREPDCGLRSIHGADVGQDLNIEVELLVPAGPAGAVTDGGPYFRSRHANPGDGVWGGTSAGFWVRLDSTGEVRVQRLNPGSTVGFSSPSPKFDPSVFHKLRTAVHGQTLQVDLDGTPVTFDVAGLQTSMVPLAPEWETASPKGQNGGSAGIAFSATRNRGKAGGQQARNIRIQPYQPLRTARP